MPKLFFLYWVPGSCGDLLQNLVSMHPDWYTGSRFSLDSNGRFVRQVDPVFRSAFPAEPNKWLWRSWRPADLDRLQVWCDKNIMIGTHQIQQIRLIKQSLQDQVTTIGVTYDQSLFPAVLKNFCIKVADTDHAINLIYQTKDPQLYSRLKQSNLFGSWVLKDFLSFGGPVPQQQASEFDIEIKLESILLGNLEWFTQWLTPESQQHLQQWLCLQDSLYQTAISNADCNYVKALGLNIKATQLDHRPIPLNSYHRALIQHHFPQAPSCRTHQDFKYFLEHTLDR